MALTGHDRAAGADPPRDPILDRAYAAGAREEPPARLDAAILAAARREVGARPQRLNSVLRAWRAPVALAAVLVLSVSVVLLLREEGADRLEQEPTKVTAPVPGRARPPYPPEPSAKPESAPEAALSKDAASRARSAPSRQARPAEEDRRRDQPSPETMQARPQAAEAPRSAEAPRPAPRPFAETPAIAAGARRAVPEAPPPQTSTLAKETESGAAAGVRERVATAEREVPAQRAPAAPAAAVPDATVGALARQEAGAKSAQPESANRMEQQLRDDVAAGAPRPIWWGYDSQPPEKWLERVEELRRAGREAEARDMLAEFRRRFPQHPVPPSLNR
jgi:hypothetical protein